MVWQCKPHGVWLKLSYGLGMDFALYSVRLRCFSLPFTASKDCSFIPEAVADSEDPAGKWSCNGVGDESLLVPVSTASNQSAMKHTGQCLQQPKFAARDAMDKLDALCRSGSRHEPQPSVSPASSNAVVIPVYHETSSSNAIAIKVCCYEACRCTVKQPCSKLRTTGNKWRRFHFGMLENRWKIVGKSYSCRKIVVQKHKWVKTVFGKFRGNIKIFSTRNHFSRKFATFCLHDT